MAYREWDGWLNKCLLMICWNDPRVLYCMLRGNFSGMTQVTIQILRQRGGWTTILVVRWRYFTPSQVDTFLSWGSDQHEFSHPVIMLQQLFLGATFPVGDIIQHLKTWGRAYCCNSKEDCFYSSDRNMRFYIQHPASGLIINRYR
jgi:hypothetical protein